MILQMAICERNINKHCSYSEVVFEVFKVGR